LTLLLGLAARFSGSVGHQHSEGHFTDWTGVLCFSPGVDAFVAKIVSAGLGMG